MTTAAKTANKTTLASLIAATAITAALAGASVGTAQAADEKEKCYGIAKAGMNDCQTPTSSCAGTSKKDGEGHAFLLVPKGTCGKLVGASVTPKAG
ncbi:DUF2282 domain-containing protein [Azospirillum griseum]|uniref:DUF2282 domain-containing protein n=1 Tax=Azospirillum griseum TaxID=2496639 RepID=A0A3S0KAB0_9PROT|nr:DUF2282 domain-containing protein [Azospirillum griseum]RTR18930.1 DUF2282 domain-containing protein [Azospirillum griseum]